MNSECTGMSSFLQDAETKRTKYIASFVPTSLARLRSEFRVYVPVPG